MYTDNYFPFFPAAASVKKTNKADTVKINEILWKWYKIKFKEDTLKILF